MTYFLLLAIASLSLSLMTHLWALTSSFRAHDIQLQVGSALSDPYLSFAAALNGLAGPLHGLANQVCSVCCTGSSLPHPAKQGFTALHTQNMSQIIFGRRNIMFLPFLN
jgi:hypothetical protein